MSLSSALFEECVLFSVRNDSQKYNVQPVPTPMQHIRYRSHTVEYPSRVIYESSPLV